MVDTWVSKQLERVQIQRSCWEVLGKPNGFSLVVEGVAKDWRGGITEYVKQWANGKAKAFQVKDTLNVFVVSEGVAVGGQ